jgi:hypothetical protein
MYRIRSASGTEAVYNSLEEFAAAVRRGDVLPEDEIFHSRANRWLDVKSHPHYRGAMNWSGPLTAAAVPAPPSPTPPPTQVRPAPQPAPAQARGQVVELPVPKPQPPAQPQTVFRPQLASDKPVQARPPTAAPAPAPVPAAPAPVVKSKELQFIDLGDAKPVSRQNVTVIEAQKPPVPPAAAPPAAIPSTPAPAPPMPAAAAAAPPVAQPVKKEPEFLVMDTGLERPVRASNGHRAVSDDLDLLFDTPLAEARPSSPAAIAVPASGPRPQVTSKEIEAAKAKAAEAIPPRPVAPLVHKRVEEDDLDIPGPALFEEPLVAVSPSMAPSASQTMRAPMGLMVGSGAVLMLAAGALLFWRPWGGRSQGGELAAGQPTTIGTTAPAAVPTGVTPESAAATGPGPLGTAAAGQPEGAAPVDSSDAPTDDRVIAALKPDFRNDVPVAAQDLDLGTEVAAPSVGIAVAPIELARRLDQAEKQAQQELTGRLGGFRGALSAARLASADGVNQAKSSWSAAADVIRLYRARIARLEQAYQDSVLASQRAQRWTGDDMRTWAAHQSPAETSETSQLADLMFSQVSEALDILASLDGQYTVKGATIRFRDPSAGSRYMAIQSWVGQRMETWAGTPETARPLTVSILLRALGDGLPAVE